MDGVRGKVVGNLTETWNISKDLLCFLHAKNWHSMALLLSPSCLLHNSPLPVLFNKRKQKDSIHHLPFFSVSSIYSFEKGEREKRKKKKKNNDALEKKLLLGILLPFIVIII